jgi:Nucleotidyltransferase substrate binding protein like
MQKGNDTYDISLFSQALDSFERGIAWNGDDEWRLNVVTHRFILCYHQARVALEYCCQQEKELHGKKFEEKLRYARDQHWITDGSLWLEMHTSRNNAAHPYTKAEALEIYERAPAYAAEIRRWFGTLQKFAENTRAGE